MVSCFLERVGCREEAVTKHNGYPLCQDHYLQGMGLMFSNYRSRDYASDFPKRNFRTPLEDMGPWQEIALRAWEDQN